MVSLFDWDENNEMLGNKYEYCCGIKVSKILPYKMVVVSGGHPIIIFSFNNVAIFIFDDF